MEKVKSPIKKETKKKHIRCSFCRKKMRAAKKYKEFPTPPSRSSDGTFLCTTLQPRWCRTHKRRPRVQVQVQLGIAHTRIATSWHDNNNPPERKSDQRKCNDLSRTSFWQHRLHVPLRPLVALPTPHPLQGPPPGRCLGPAGGRLARRSHANCAS